MFRRIKNIISLSKHDQNYIDESTFYMKQREQELGDGKAVFFGEGTEQELKEQEEKDKGFIGRVFGL